jgi:hypothetical protein
VLNLFFGNIGTIVVRVSMALYLFFIFFISPLFKKNYTILL